MEKQLLKWWIAREISPESTVPLSATERFILFQLIVLVTFSISYIVFWWRAAALKEVRPSESPPTESPKRTLSEPLSRNFCQLLLRHTCPPLTLTWRRPLLCSADSLGGGVSSRYSPPRADTTTNFLQNCRQIMNVFSHEKKNESKLVNQVPHACSEDIIVVG